MRLEELKKELIGFEGSCLDVDNKVSSLGFYDEYDMYNEENIESCCIGYVSKEDSDDMIIIDFEVTIEAGNDEDIKATYIKITDIR